MNILYDMAVFHNLSLAMQNALTLLWQFISCEWAHVPSLRPITVFMNIIFNQATKKLYKNYKIEISNISLLGYRPPAIEGLTVSTGLAVSWYSTLIPKIIRNTICTIARGIISRMLFTVAIVIFFLSSAQVAWSRERV